MGVGGKTRRDAPEPLALPTRFATVIDVSRQTRRDHAPAAASSAFELGLRGSHCRAPDICVLQATVTSAAQPPSCRDCFPSMLTLADAAGGSIRREGLPFCGTWVLRRAVIGRPLRNVSCGRDEP